MTTEALEERTGERLKARNERAPASATGALEVFTTDSLSITHKWPNEASEVAIAPLATVAYGSVEILFFRHIIV